MLPSPIEVLFLSLFTHIVFRIAADKSCFYPVGACDNDRSFRSKLGCSPDVCSTVWEMISRNNKPQACKPKHLLWALLFVKLYSPGTVLAEMVGTSRDVYAKWVWIVLKLIAGVLDDVVVWDNRLKTDDRNKYCMVTVDGTDFRIQEPSPFSPMWYSHKFKGPGLRYEVAVSIRGGDIVHINGPYACGSWPDISIFREILINKLHPGEMVEADRGYRGEPTKIRTPIDAGTRRQRKMKSRARACQETVNKRFKQFGILKQVYRHDIRIHKHVFEAIVVITQLSLRHGEPLFGVHFY